MVVVVLLLHTQIEKEKSEGALKRAERVANLVMVTYYYSTLVTGNATGTHLPRLTGWRTTRHPS